MEFSIQREPLLNILQRLSGIAEKRQTLPILSYALLTVDDNQLALTGTDTEVTLASRTAITRDRITEIGTITVPVKKLVDICRSLPQGATLNLHHQGNRLNIRCQCSHFQVVTLPVDDFPNDKDVKIDGPEFHIDSQSFKKVLQQTHFAIAQQDVRTYLNGLLIELHQPELRVIASDGHRLALSRFTMPEANEPQEGVTKVIMPRKSVLELMRLMDQLTGRISLQMGSRGVRFHTNSFDMVTRLVEGPYPNYDNLIPDNSSKRAIIGRENFKQALMRAAIVSNDQFRTVRLQFSANQLIILAENNQREQAKEEMEVDYTGDSMEIGFNVNYLLDVVNHNHSDSIVIEFSDSSTSVLLKELEDDSNIYVIMPLCI